MSKYYDGSDEPLTYAQALVRLAQVAPFPSAAESEEVVRAIQKEHELLPPDPDTHYADPKDGTINSLEAKVAQLEAEAAARAKADKEAELEAKVAQLEAEAAARQTVQV